MKTTNVQDTLMIPEGVRHLLVKELRVQRGILSGLLLTWVAGLWILVIFNHPGWFLALGLVYVVMAVPQRAGVDILDGTEEFSFSLPPGRGPLYLSRAAPGIVLIVLLGTVGGLALALDLPQRLWMLVFSGGLTDPFTAIKARYWYALGVLFPLTAQAFTFYLAANAVTRAGVISSWILGILGALLVAGLSAFVEQMAWRSANGILSAPALLSCCVLVHLCGYRAYLQKEATRSGGQVQKSRGFGGLVLVVVGVVLLLLVFLLFWVQKANVPVRQEAEVIRFQHSSEGGKGTTGQSPRE